MDRALMHTNSEATPHCIDHWPTQDSSIGVHALDDAEAPQGPPQDLSLHMIDGFFKGDEGKLEQFVSGDVLLLLPVNNEDGVRDTSTRQKAELYLVNVHLLVNGAV